LLRAEGKMRQQALKQPHTVFYADVGNAACI
jgi:hypothetical protein